MDCVSILNSHAAHCLATIVSQNRRCMRIALGFNHLNNDFCISLIADISFQINYMSSIYRSECLQWLDSFEFDDFISVAVIRCEVWHPTCYVGHLRMPPHVLSGKYLPAFNKVWSVINGNGVHGTDIEILAVHPGYQVTWMPFHAGDTLPVGAVEGGYFSNIIILLFVVHYDPVGPMLPEVLWGCAKNRHGPSCFVVKLSLIWDSRRKNYYIECRFPHKALFTTTLVRDLNPFGNLIVLWCAISD